MSQLHVTGHFCRGLRRTLDDHGVNRFSLNHVVAMHCPTVQAPKQAITVLFPMGQLYAYVLVSKDPSHAASVGCSVTASLLLDNQEFQKLPKTFDFKLSGRAYMAEIAIDLGNIEIAWPADKINDMKKLILRFADSNNDVVGEISMLLEVELRKI